MTDRQDGWMDGQMDGWISASIHPSEQTDGWMEGRQMEELTISPSLFKKSMGITKHALKYKIKLSIVTLSGPMKVVMNRKDFDHVLYIMF